MRHLVERRDRREKVLGMPRWTHNDVVWHSLVRHEGEPRIACKRNVSLIPWLGLLYTSNPSWVTCHKCQRANERPLRK